MKSKLYVFAVLTFVMSLGVRASAAEYCMAIRGNGEIEPAHWGAVAKVIEKLGLPEMQAGGSSASITMLLIDAVASNPLVKNSEGQSARAALLVKSLEGFAGELTTTPEWQDFQALYKQAQELKNASWVQDMQLLFAEAEKLNYSHSKALLNSKKDLLMRNYEVGKKLGLIDPQSYAPLFQAIHRISAGESGGAFTTDVATAKFYSTELYNAVTVFGAFNAETDSGLFFRPGIVNFSRLADQFGRIADFYSMESANADENRLWQEFFATCEEPSRDVTWGKLIAAHPECASQFSQLVKSHFQNARGNFALHPIGVTIPSFPTTTVLTEHAHQQAVTAAHKYLVERDRSVGQDFTPIDPVEVRFGYWGREDLLRKIEAHLDFADEKSRRFKSLGMATWEKALGLSPAEPGLSPLKTFVSKGEEMTSAGGWSDLHPVLLLQAAGCENVVYITRRGGESLFGQGVAKRLLGLNRPWNLISTATAESRKASALLNNNGDPSDMATIWSRLYNLANPKSSFKRALGAAAAVVCTSWDNFEITQGVHGMIEDSYSSPFFVNPQGGLRGENLLPQLDPSEQSPDGYPTYAGCY